MSHMDGDIRSLSVDPQSVPIARCVSDNSALRFHFLNFQGYAKPQYATVCLDRYRAQDWLYRQAQGSWRLAAKPDPNEDIFCCNRSSDKQLHEFPGETD